MRMRTVLSCLLIGPLLGSSAISLADEINHSALHDFRVVEIAGGLERPWSIGFLPGGDLLVTEKAGRLRIIREGELLDDPVAGVPEVHAQGQGGLLDVVPHPDFANNRLLYLSYAKPLDGGESTTAVIRGRFENDRLSDIEEVFQAVSQGRGHYGCRLVFDGKGYLYLTVGDRQARPAGDLTAHPAQDLGKHQGVVVRIHEDGRVPEDNPFVDQSDARPETWSYGHRNAQGMAMVDGELWLTEHGPQGGDELNRVVAGRNYGWPVIGYGVNYRTGDRIHESTHAEGMEQPAKIWVPSIGTSGLAHYQGDAFPNWRGHLLAGGMSGERVVRLELDGQEIAREEELVRGLGRVRDVRVGPDGLVYLALDHRSERTAIVRLEPVPRQEIAER